MVVYPPKSFEARVLKEIKSNRLIEAGDKIIVAVSGGPDSISLLHLLWSQKDNLGITVAAAHYNHRLRGEESDRDEEFVKKICLEWGIECSFGSAPKMKQFKNEVEARNSRYEFFEKNLRKSRGAKIALAHNANDLAETVLFRLIRGTGLRGLSAIPLRRGNFIRPLLRFDRGEIERYLATNKLEYRQDLTNLDPTPTRNFLRLKVFPLLKKLNPSVITTLGTEARVASEDYDFLEKIARRGFDEVLIEKKTDEIVLNWQVWRHYHPAMKRLIIRLALAEIGLLVDITVNQLEEAILVLNRGIGGKYKPLPHSLQIGLFAGKIRIRKILSS